MSNKIKEAIRKNKFYNQIREDLAFKLRARRTSTQFSEKLTNNLVAIGSKTTREAE